MPRTDPLKPWTAQRRRAYQRPDGKYRGDKLAPLFEQLREQGLTLPQIADLTGIPSVTVHNALRATSRAPRTGILAQQIAREVGITDRAMQQHLKEKGVPFTRYGVKMWLTDEMGEQVRAYYLNTITAEEARHPDWITLPELAALLGNTPKAIYQRLRTSLRDTITSKRVRGVVGNQRRYSRPDALQYRSQQPIALSAPPAGALTAQQVADLLGIYTETVRHYARNGAPHVQVVQGGMVTRYFHPAALAAWMQARGHRVTRSLGRTLAALTQQQGAA